MMKYPSELSSDYDNYGFDRSELIKFLAAEGIHISEVPNAAPAAEKPEVPEWAKLSKAIKQFTLGEAADILIGIDPWHQGWRGDDGEREFGRACAALERAVWHGDLRPVSTDDHGHKSFHAQDLREWAESVGLEWCIPPTVPATAVTPIGTADDATLDRLRQLEAENARLTEQVAELQRQLQEAATAAQQATAPAPQQATAAPQDDEGMPPHPKRETTYLNTIGALVELIQTPRPERNSEAAVIREVVDNYGDRPGIAKRTLEGLFAEAKRRVQSV